MLRIDNIKTEPGAGEEALRRSAAALLRVSAGEITALRVLRRSIDARDGVRFVWSAAVSLKNEAAALKRCKNKSRRRARAAPRGHWRGAGGTVLRAGAGKVRRETDSFGTRQACGGTQARRGGVLENRRA